jgi:hypothetical protein
MGLMVLGSQRQLLFLPLDCEQRMTQVTFTTQIASQQNQCLTLPFHRPQALDSIHCFFF